MGGFTIRERVSGGLTLWIVLLDCSVGWFCWVVLGKSAPPIAISSASTRRCMSRRPAGLREGGQGLQDGFRVVSMTVYLSSELHIVRLPPMWESRTCRTEGGLTGVSRWL